MFNPQEQTMTTASLARLVGYSTQQVRDLERLGVLPPAERAANGYRQYRTSHEVALRAYRALAVAVGPVAARSLMPTLRTASVGDAAERIDGLHAEIQQQRIRVREALRALDAVTRDTTDDFDDRDAMSIGDLADALGVRTSALRHWEAEGLVTPQRRPGSGVRRYGAEAIAAARITAALRGGEYGLPPIARVIDLIRAHGRTDEARMLLQRRLDGLTERSVALLAASSSLHALLLSDTGG